MRRYLPLAMLLTVWLGGCGPETLPPAGSGQAGDIVVQETTRATPQATAVSPLPSPQPSPEMTVVEPSVTATALPEPVQFPEALTPTLIPTPDVNATTVPELDGITFVNPKPLQLPSETEDVFGVDLVGQIAWSPDSQYFVATLRTSTLESGDTERPVLDLFMGDPDTGELTLWQRNAGWASWSRDGRSIYYVALRSNGDNFYRDLYKRSVDSLEPELILNNIGIPSGLQPGAVETKQGDVLALSQEGQLELVRYENGNSVLMPNTLPGIQNARGSGVRFSLAPDGHTMAVYTNPTEIRILDLESEEESIILVGESSVTPSVNWSDDSRYLAYASSQGLFVYDQQTDRFQEVVTRQDLNFPAHDLYSGFSIDSWSPSEQVLLFGASTPDWSDRGGQTPAGFRFVATVAGDSWRAVWSQFSFDTVAPDGSKAIVTDWSEWPQARQYLIDLVW